MTEVETVRPNIQINGWFGQMIMYVMIGITGFFMTNELSEIKEELRISRVERAQLRTDMASLEVGLRGDRFTRSDWVRESGRIENQLERIRERLRVIENGDR